MPVSRFMARQFARPRGLFGRLFLGGMLDRANVRGNALVYEALAVAPSDHVFEVGFGGGDLLVRLAGTVAADGSRESSCPFPCSGGSMLEFVVAAWAIGCACRRARSTRCPSKPGTSTVHAASTQSTSGRICVGDWRNLLACCAPEDAWCSGSDRMWRCGGPATKPWVPSLLRGGDRARLAGERTPALGLGAP